MPALVFEGDTIYARTEVLARRKSKSRPNMGLVEIKTTGFQQDGTGVMEFWRTVLVYERGHLTSVASPHSEGMMKGIVAVQQVGFWKVLSSAAWLMLSTFVR